MKPNGKGALAARLATDPAWEAAKAASRNIDPNDAVQESFYLQKLYQQMWGDPMAASPVDVNQVLLTLTRKRIPFVLTGTHGIGTWTGRPRATYDVDILVKGGRNYTRAVNAMKELYPQLETRVFAGVTGFFVPGDKQSVLDITYPHREDLQDTLANPVWTENKTLRLRYRIPSLEAALANKYGAMLTPTRDMGKRLVDAADFSWMVKHSLDEGRRPADLKKLAALGEKVWPGGGGEEILRLVETVKAGSVVNLDSLVGRLKPKEE